MTTFGTLNPDGSLTNVRVINQSDLMKCPHFILTPEHYRDDATCKCNDPDDPNMADWGYVFNSATGFWDSPEEEE